MSILWHLFLAILAFCFAWIFWWVVLGALMWNFMPVSWGGPITSIYILLCVPTGTWVFARTISGWK